jgi:hypothetical protein
LALVFTAGWARHLTQVAQRLAAIAQAASGHRDERGVPGGTDLPV